MLTLPLYSRDAKLNCSLDMFYVFKTAALAGSGLAGGSGRVLKITSILCTCPLNGPIRSLSRLYISQILHEKPYT